MPEKPGKTFKRVQKLRDEEYVPPHDPAQPFTRQYQKSKMPWQLETIRQGRWDVLVVYILAWAAVIGIILFVFYHVIMFFLDMWGTTIGPVLFPGVIRILWL